AAELGYGAMGLVDSGDLGGMIRFALSAEARGVRPIAGTEIRVDGRPVGLLARDEAGYRNLAHLVTRARLETERGAPGLTPDVIGARSDGLVLLTGPPNAELSRLLRERGEDVARERLARWKESFGDRVVVEVQRHHVSGGEEVLARALVELAERTRTRW